MKIKDSPMLTGISAITGKTTRIRHATEADMVFIEEKIRKYNLDAKGLHHSQFVVAVEEDDIIGFGRLRVIGKIYSIGCIAVIEEKRGSGVGSLIVKHLIETSPEKIIYVLTDIADYFKKLGFVELKEGAKELYDELDRACGVPGARGARPMFYERKA